MLSKSKQKQFLLRFCLKIFCICFRWFWDKENTSRKKIREKFRVRGSSARNPPSQLIIGYHWYAWYQVRKNLSQKLEIQILLNEKFEKNRENIFEYVSKYCASFGTQKNWPLLRVGGACMSLTRAGPSFPLNTYRKWKMRQVSSEEEVRLVRNQSENGKGGS